MFYFSLAFPTVRGKRKLGWIGEVRLREGAKRVAPRGGRGVGCGGTAGPDRRGGRFGHGERVLASRSAGGVPGCPVAEHESHCARSVPERRTELSECLAARRPARPGRLQRLGYQHPGIRVVSGFGPVDLHAGGRPVQLLRRLVPARLRQGRLLHLQVGDLPDPGGPGLARRQPSGQAERDGRRRPVDGRLVVDDAGRLASRLVHLRRLDVGLPEPVRGIVAVPDRCLDG